jgi:tRNA modification GTPase
VDGKALAAEAMASGASAALAADPRSRALGDEDGRPCVRVSALTGEGLSTLNAWMEALFEQEDLGGAALITSERHAVGLTQVHAALTTARAALGVGTLELVAGEVALAHEALSGLLGERADRELLDALFARFCIGK